MTEMLVETCEAEAIVLIESLGLEGQQELLVPTERDSHGARLPYLKLTSEQQSVFQLLYPQETGMSVLSSPILPSPVQEIANHAKEVFKELFVWERANNSSQDNLVLIGCNDTLMHRDMFLLARWGNALEPYSSLKEKATSVFRRNRKNRLIEIVEQANALIETADNHPSNLCIGLSLPSFYK